MTGINVNNSLAKVEFTLCPKSWLATSMKTYQPRPADIPRAWHLIDAEDLVLGRLAVVIATLLRGKDKPIYSPHLDCGDFVIVVNAEKIYLSGRKKSQKEYFRHTGYPGGIKRNTVAEVLEGHRPSEVIERAVFGMLPKNRLRKKMMGRLKVYVGPDHPHGAQQPEICEVWALNEKNSIATERKAKEAVEEAMNGGFGDVFDNLFAYINNKNNKKKEN